MDCIHFYINCGVKERASSSDVSTVRKPEKIKAPTFSNIYLQHPKYCGIISTKSLIGSFQRSRTDIRRVQLPLGAIVERRQWTPEITRLIAQKDWTHVSNSSKLPDTSHVYQSIYLHLGTYYIFQLASTVR